MSIRLSEGLTVFALIILINVMVHFLLQGPEPHHFELPLEAPTTHTGDTAVLISPLMHIPSSGTEQSLKWLFHALPSN